MEVNKAVSVAQFSPKRELAWHESSWLQLCLPETLPTAWRRLTQSYCFSVLLMFEKNPPGHMILRIQQKNNRLIIKLVPSAGCGRYEEMHALGMMAVYYGQLSSHILK